MAGGPCVHCGTPWARHRLKGDNCPKPNQPQEGEWWLAPFDVLWEKTKYRTRRAWYNEDAVGLSFARQRHWESFPLAFPDDPVMERSCHLSAEDWSRVEWWNMHEADESEVERWTRA
jgi:hypothetical protein